MCDHDSMDDMQKATELSRRQFGALGLGAGVIAMLPRAADAAEVSEREVTIKTPDGSCDAHFVHPKSGASAAVLVWPDIFGLRDPFRQMGKRLAESGYAVLTVNPFYRTQKAPTAPPNPNFQDPPTRDALFKLAGTLNATTHNTDAKAFVTWLDAQSQVDKKRKIGTTGYCMGGPMVMRAAAARADRIGAGATFHGGGLTTDAPDSPHLLIPKMKAAFLICIADNDDKKEPASKDILRKSFADAKVPAVVEVFAGAQHGWCAIDSQVYNKEQAEKAWAAQLQLFKNALA
ncbi:MAG TPA: dienelactone hydrolase family protein [Steroidobacteraceae bacterium]|nr:dienelactone hydrolase family protein [Steroidobacteraceae bacterium]